MYTNTVHELSLMLQWDEEKSFYAMLLAAYFSDAKCSRLRALTQPRARHLTWIIPYNAQEKNNSYKTQQQNLNIKIYKIIINNFMSCHYV